MSLEYPLNVISKIRFLIRDVRDKERIIRAFKEGDYLIHAAVMKLVLIVKYNPSKCVKTNIDGARNVIKSCLQTNIKGIVALSMNKAFNHINLYGYDKLASDTLFVAANYITD